MDNETTHLALTPDEKKLFEELIPEDLDEIMDTGFSRRHFLKLMSIASAGALAANMIGTEQVLARPFSEQEISQIGNEAILNPVKVSFQVNGLKKNVEVDSRMTLLDTLRENIGLTGAKKGCDHGQCGACTMIVNGERILSCLTLAATCQGKSITSIEGIANGNLLHPMQSSFIKHDGFQCGYCTSGQICSAVALLSEARKGEVSYVTKNIRKTSAPLVLSDEEIRERMSGNICRCGAYPNIVAAIAEVQSGKLIKQTWDFAG
jgi:xanthine dehydrogenase YagT iron-sulfur-binding subunit